MKGRLTMDNNYEPFNKIGIVMRVAARRPNVSSSITFKRKTFTLKDQSSPKHCSLHSYEDSLATPFSPSYKSFSYKQAFSYKWLDG